MLNLMVAMKARLPKPVALVGESHNESNSVDLIGCATRLLQIPHMTMVYLEHLQTFTESVPRAVSTAAYSV
jgi:hypothetical protein